MIEAAFIICVTIGLLCSGRLVARSGSPLPDTPQAVQEDNAMGNHTLFIMLASVGIALALLLMGGK